jgi:hypothetical protein
MIATFRVHPVRRGNRGVGDYFVVELYRTKTQMRDAIRKSTGKTRGHLWTMGQCSWYTKLDKVRGRWIRQRECGTIFLCSVAGGAGVITHEMTHAAFAWLWKRRKWRPRWNDTGLEEPLAWTVGWLVTQYWREYFKRFAK